MLRRVFSRVQRHLPRRRLLYPLVALVAAALVAVTLFITGYATALTGGPTLDSFRAGSPAGGSWHFPVSGLDPPSVTVTTHSATPPGFVFVSPMSGTGFLGKTGPLIVDGSGDPVWAYSLPAGQKATDFTVQTYQGKPVLTWWQGTITPLGYGKGEDVIMDSSYKVIATVPGTPGFQPDLHEFYLTPQGTAWVTSYHTVTADLTAVGGPASGQVLDSLIEEIDVQTGQVLFRWDAMQHISLTDSYQPYKAGKPYDAFHLNSAVPGPNGDVLISSRHTSTVFDVSLKTGAIIWRLGGKQSTFTIASDARFAWQHDARFQGSDLVSLFNNASPLAGAKASSSAMVLRLDFAGHTASLAHGYTLKHLLATSQGSLQELGGGKVFVGWGAQPWYAEYDSSGGLVYAAHFHAPDQSYRAFALQWNGSPSRPPSLAVTSNGGKATAYAWWNGATGVARWKVLQGSAPGKLKAVGRAARRGFMTGIRLPHSGGYVKVQALDAHGHVLGTSRVVRV